MNGKGNSMVMDRTHIHGSHECRNGVLRNLDAHLVKGGAMREAIIISVILIMAVVAWMPKKGGRK